VIEEKKGGRGGVKIRNERKPKEKEERDNSKAARLGIGSSLLLQARPQKKKEKQ